MISVNVLNLEVKRSQHVHAVFEESEIGFTKKVEKGEKTVQWCSISFVL